MKLFKPIFLTLLIVNYFSLAFAEQGEIATLESKLASNQSQISSYNQSYQNSERTRINNLISVKNQELLAEQAFIDAQESKMQSAVQADLNYDSSQVTVLTTLGRTIGFVQGLVQGLWSVVEAAGFVVFNPLTTIQGIGSSVVNYDRTAEAIYEALQNRKAAVVQVDSNSFISIYNQSSAVGQTTFDVCTVVCTLGAGVAVKGVQSAKLSVNVSSAANKSAEVSRISQALKVAAQNSIVVSGIKIGNYSVSISSKSVIVSSQTAIQSYRFQVVRNFEQMVRDLVGGKLVARSEFTNSLAKLPIKQSGYYKEWTLVTPEYPNFTGPERLITGLDGEIFYTPDHYTTFIKITQ